MAATKFQITLPLEKAVEWKLAAQQRGIPLAEWIRVTMDRELNRASESETKPAIHWLDSINVPEEDPTVSSRIDELLYGE